MAKYSISITELTKDADQQNPRVLALLGDLEEGPANKKVISVMYLALGDAARKQFMEKYPTTALGELRAQQLINLCKKCFRKKRNRTLDHHKVFSRVQQPGESLSQFWHAMNGLAALCDFGEISTTLVLDIFYLHMSNKKVREKLCTEPKEPDQALEFAGQEAKGLQVTRPRKCKTIGETRASMCDRKNQPPGMLQVWGGELHHGTCKLLHGHQSPL